MKFAFVFITLITSSFSLAAEKAVIQQMKGRRAIVQFEKDIPFSVGQKIYLNSDDGSEYGVSTVGRNPMVRKNSVSLAATFRTTETKPNPTNYYSISGRYGWNLERYELGPMGTYTLNKVGSSESTSMLFGGFFDFNMIPNKPGEDIIWGAYGEANFGTAKTGNVSSNLTTATGGGFVKWFVFSPMLAARVNIFYSYNILDRASSTSTTKNYSASGLEIGLTNYF